MKSIIWQLIEKQKLDNITWLALRPKPIKKLSGFISRWRNPLECMYSTLLIWKYDQWAGITIDNQRQKYVKKNDLLPADLQASTLFLGRTFCCSSWKGLPSLAQEGQWPWHCIRSPPQTIWGWESQLHQRKNQWDKHV